MQRHLEETFYDASPKPATTQTTTTPTTAATPAASQQGFGAITVTVFHHGHPTEVKCTEGSTPRMCMVAAGIQFEPDMNIIVNGQQLAYFDQFQPLKTFPKSSLGKYVIAIV